MTPKQIKSINNAMSFLASVNNNAEPLPEVFSAIAESHYNDLIKAEVNSKICDHFWALCGRLAGRND